VMSKQEKESFKALGQKYLNLAQEGGKEE